MSLIVYTLLNIPCIKYQEQFHDTETLVIHYKSQLFIILWLNSGLHIHTSDINLSGLCILYIIQIHYCRMIHLLGIYMKNLYSIHMSSSILTLSSGHNSIKSA